MYTFKSLFGISAKEIKNTCVLTPFCTKFTLKAFGISQFHKTGLYASVNAKTFTLIKTGIGAPFVGDAVLYLEKTTCKNIILFGSCGLIPERQNNMKIGDLVIPQSALDLENFLLEE